MAGARAEQATFCSCDVAGSTRLLKSVGERVYRGVLERYRELVGVALAGQGGRVLQVEGDGLLVELGSPQAAVGFCLAAQRALHVEDWPVGAAVRVRMGVACGEGGRLLAERVAGVGAGGQVLFGAELTGLVTLPAGARLTRLGRYRVPGVDTALDLAELTAHDLPRGFGPLRAVREDSGLPIPRTSLVGREQELGELVAALGSDRFLVLLGPGGVGKTRLALEAAAGQDELFGDGITLVELSAAAGSGEVAANVATALGARPVAGQSDLDIVVAHLAQDRVLLVLDSCERVLDGVSELVETVLRRCPATTVLATSTAALTGPPARVIPVEPLEVPAESPTAEQARDSPAVELLAQRAAAHGGPGDDPARDLPALAEIARRLDGIPLALELAAGRIAELGVEPVLAGLDDRFSLLTNGYRTALPRHRTLEAMVAWTAEQLTPDEQDLLGRLSELRGRWPLNLITDVTGGPGGPTALHHLLDMSLLTIEHGTTPRIRMLDTIRAYAQRHLTPTARTDTTHRRLHALDRHLRSVQLDAVDWEASSSEFLALLPDIREALRIDEETDLGVAADLCVVAGLWFLDFGGWLEALELFQPVADACPPGAHRSLVLVRLAALHALMGQPEKAHAAAREVLAEPATSDDARSAALLVHTSPSSPSLDRRADLEEALRLAGSPTSQAGLLARAQLAVQRAGRGDQEGAVAEFEAVVADCTRPRDASIRVSVLQALGAALTSVDPERAEAVVREAYELASRLRLRPMQGAAMQNLAVLALRRGDLAEARRLAEERLALSESINYLAGQSQSLNVLGMIAAAQGDKTFAREVTARSLAVARQLGHTEGMVVGLFNLTVMDSTGGAARDTVPAAAEALELACASRLAPLVGLALTGAAALLCLLGREEGPAVLAAARRLLPEGLPLDPSDVVWADEARATAVERLGAEAVGESEERGASLDLAEAIALARTGLQAVDATEAAR